MSTLNDAKMPSLKDKIEGGEEPKKVVKKNPKSKSKK